MMVTDMCVWKLIYALICSNKSSWIIFTKFSIMLASLHQEHYGKGNSVLLKCITTF